MESTITVMAGDAKCWAPALQRDWEAVILNHWQPSMHRMHAMRVYQVLKRQRGLWEAEWMGIVYGLHTGGGNICQPPTAQSVYCQVWARAPALAVVCGVRGVGWGEVAIKAQ